MLQKAERYYQQEFISLSKKLEKYNSISSRIGITRLVLFISIISGIWLFFYNTLWGIIGLFGAVIFVFVVVFDSKIKRRLEKLNAWRSILEDELNDDPTKRTLYDNGQSYLDKNHEYANDMDLFGKSSVFQFINRCYSKSGCAVLSSWLLNPASPEDIIERQAAIAELSRKQLFRKEMGISGVIGRGDFAGNESNWIGNAPMLKKLGKLKLLLLFFSGVNVTLLFLSIVNATMVLPCIGFLTFSYFYIYSFQWHKIKYSYHNISKTDRGLRYFRSVIELIEKESFDSQMLLRIQAELKLNHETGIGTIKSLQNIIQWTDLRLNFFYQIFVNAFFYTDIWLLFRIEKWKLLHGKQFLSWQKSIGQIEALQSLAVIYFNHPDWCLPAMSKNFHIKLENAGHPLIPDSTRVNNSYEASQTGVVDVLTGSNMSGKSTFLRTLGVNIILALAGAPVCADKMLISSLKLMTCMRVQDDLHDRTSTFYAEIKRLKRIMIENEKESQSFFLLDEPLRGTNSNDKRAGSLAIMKNIIMQKSNAVIATHDVAIADLPQQFDENIRKFYFDIKVNNGLMYFDFKLQKGLCKSSNAALLLNEIGVDISSENVF